MQVEEDFSPMTIVETLSSHIGLPARLPGRQDESTQEVAVELIRILLDAVSDITYLPNIPLLEEWESLRRSLELTQTVNTRDGLHQESIISTVQRLLRDDFVLLHIMEQNAAVVVRHQSIDNEATLVFEISEASPKSHEALKSSSALVMDFPNLAVAMPLSAYNDGDLENELAVYMAQASRESVKYFAAHARKAQSRVYESRDVADPIMMTGILAIVLKSQGRSYYPSILRKRVRDDVCWDGTGQNPWRRSPMWLMLRVSVERHLRSIMGQEFGRIQYKILMCLFHSKFLSEYTTCPGRNEEVLHHLNKKLVLRIEKLHREALNLTTSKLSKYYSLRNVLGEIFDQSIRNATLKITGIVTCKSRILILEKRVSSRKEFSQFIDVQNIPRYAEQSDYRLKMSNSHSYIEKVRNYEMNGNEASDSTNFPANLNLHKLSMSPFTEKYFKLAELEFDIMEELYSSSTKNECPEKKCIALANRIKSYLEAIGSSYDKNPEQKSKMLLIVLLLWVEMDKEATKLIGLLTEFSPGISKHITEVLLLTNAEDLELLFKIQRYLEQRENECKKPQMTIFSQPTEGCFAEQYYDRSSIKSIMRRTHTSITEEASRIREQKREELVASNSKYRSIEQKLTALDHEHSDTWNYLPGCCKCELQYVKSSLRIDIHEWPLPSSILAAKILIFELNCPREFAAYRDATWQILAGLASPHLNSSSLPPQLFLDQYKVVTKFSTVSWKLEFTIASTTKSFLNTHYAHVRIPANEDDVLLSNGTNFCYYDTRYGIWSHELPETSFVHHCNFYFPKDSPYKSMLEDKQLPVDRPGPSSYSIIASQLECPKMLSMPEFLAIKGLFVGYEQRWPQILIELGSSNINFSSESVMVLINLLALQVGPSDKVDIKGTVSQVFGDHKFCGRLIYWIDWHLDDISSTLKRKEVYRMETLITICLRVYELGGKEFRMKILALIEKARGITIKWLFKLNEDIQSAENLKKEKILSHYVAWAALLCRRTFVVFHDSKTIPEAQLCTFINCSILLQLNFSDSVIALPVTLKSALVRDLKMVWSIRGALCQSVQFSEILPIISRHVSSSSLSLHEESTKMEILSKPYDSWIIIRTQGQTKKKSQVIAFNLLTGKLLVNGISVGTLPEDLRDNVTFKRLFGTGSVRIWPSELHGMDYKLACKKTDYAVHFGTRDGKTIIKALRNEDIFEIIPDNIFLGKRISDLPHDLIKNCVHWLNFNQNRIEIRHISDPWKQKPKDWVFDLKNYTAYRESPDNIYTQIIDSHSSLFRTISNIFKNFENPNELVVFQRNNGPIQIKLPRLNLRFFINENCRLECTELKSEIDLNQDAETWYGLKSKLVLQEIERIKKNSGDTIIPLHSRSVLVLIGSLSIEKSGPHVKIKVSSTGRYARFTINKVLGRLDTTDSSNQYLKAYYHAVTSCIHPDPLTGRTGTEEAFSILNSAICQPATPLLKDQKATLKKIAHLTPQRNFYPRCYEEMQETSWDSNINISAQHDGFRIMVNRILEKSQQLINFFDEQTEDHSADVNFYNKLNERSLTRRVIYERQLPGVLCVSDDMKYSQNYNQEYTTAFTNLNKCIQNLHKWSSHIHTKKNIGSLLEGWHNFQGFKDSFSSPLLSDLLVKDLPSYWGSLVNSMRSSNEDSKYKLIFLLGTISFHEEIDMDAIMILIAFAISDELKVVTPPIWSSYDQFVMNETPKASKLFRIMQPKIKLFESKYEFVEKNLLELEATNLVNKLIEKWPSASPIFPDSKIFSRNDVEKLIITICPEWTRLFRNHQLSIYLTKIQLIMDRICSINVKKNLKVESSNEFPEKKIMPRGYRRTNLPTLSLDFLSGDIFIGSANKMREEVTDQAVQDNLIESVGNRSQGTQAEFQEMHEKSNSGMINLKQILGGLELSQSTIERNYAKDLVESTSAFEKKNLEPKHIFKNVSGLDQHIDSAEVSVEKILKHIADSCENFMAHRSERLKNVGLWPYIGPISLLELLRSTSKCQFGPGAKEILVEYAISITKLQRWYRIHEAKLKGQMSRLGEELRNFGHENWSPISQPDWLLLEIDSNILLRPVQVDVAQEIISPKSKRNSVLQMNMGQGKTSCILPIAAATLADGNNLMRVIVPRALLAQNIQLLQIRLGGLVNREIKHIPFNRKLAKNPEICSRYLQQLKYIQESQSIMVTLPEHLLSFKLSGQQALSDDNPSAEEMIEAQRWISSRSRDIIDECDEILALRTQLVYPFGTQKVVDGHPTRWETTEDILGLVVSHVTKLEKSFPQSISVKRRSESSFPLICIIQDKIGELLISEIVQEICSGHSHILPRCSVEDLTAIKEFISKIDVQDSVSRKIDSLTVDKPIPRKVIYLLRGLLAHQVLITSLKKRWNVQYGLHPHRDPIAIPFYAKGCPSDQSEWGHPDVAITLTCLAFYHEGINVDQIHNALRNISQTNDPDQVFEGLIKGNNLPQKFSHWNNINVEDELMVKEIWKHLRHSIKVINFFLNIFVFPKHATQFEIKLTTTAWDIPSFELDRIGIKQESCTPLTTGFSGTNDWKRLLPLTIYQQDLESLSHTNAEVLSYLLQNRNQGFFLAADSNGKRLSEQDLLREISKQKITVIIDAGAQIMEMDNFSLAQAWLKINPDAQAAFYFNKENKPRILYKMGQDVSFYSSIYTDSLQGCLVYLDQAHTRGTDLKLYANVKGALTLGLNQTKDHTVQAAMRLRQLGSTQSIVFFAPPEVHQSILSLEKKTPKEKLTSNDVVSWLLKQTCLGIGLLLPHFYAQGVEFCKRSQASFLYPRIFDKTTQDCMNYLSEIHQMEALSLDELYGRKRISNLSIPPKMHPIIADIIEKLKCQCEEFLKSGNDYYASVMQEIEQEQDILTEVQAIKQIQKPVEYKPLIFPGLHPDIRAFLNEGKVRANANGYESAFDYIRRTILGKKYGINKEATSQKLFVSVEYARIAHQAREIQTDHLYRSVNWVLWSFISNLGIVIIPEETEIILSLLRKAPSAVHLFSYSAPTTQKMLLFNDFDHYNIPSMSSEWYAPSWLRIEVGILAGRQYFDYLEYNELIKYLGVKQIEGRIIEDANQLSESTIQLNKTSDGFTLNPLSFLQEWLALRGHGKDFRHTPMGHICKGRALPVQNQICFRLKHKPCTLEEDEN